MPRSKSTKSKSSKKQAPAPVKETKEPEFDFTGFLAELTEHVDALAQHLSSAPVATVNRGLVKETHGRKVALKYLKKIVSADLQDVSAQVKGIQRRLATLTELTTETPKSTIKRAKSAYMFFCDDMREQVTEELKADEDVEFTQKLVVSRLGELWREVKDDPKKVAKYTKRASKDKKRYDSEVASS